MQRKSSIEFDFLFEHTQTGIILTDEKLSILKINRYLCNLYNFNYDFYSQLDNLSSLFENSLTDNLISFFQSGNEENEIVNLPLTLNNKTNIVTIKLFKKNNLFWIFINKDSTLFKLNDKFDKLGFGYIILNRNLDIININNVLQNYFGSTINKNFIEFFFETEAGYLSTHTGQTHLEYEREIETIIGLRWFKIIIFNNIFNELSMNYFSVILFDITSFKAMITELQKKNKMVLENIRLKNEFIANITHELKTPLTTIIGYIELMSKKIESASSEIKNINSNSFEKTNTIFLNKALPIILKSSNRLHYLINNLLKFSEIEQNHAQIHISLIDFYSIFDDLKYEVSGLLIDKKINLNFMITAAAQNCKFYSDSVKIKVIISNLLVNAIKFTNSGFVNITADFDKQNGDVIISVKDSGIGIPENFQHLIFEPFRQVDGSLSRKFSGAGLGLRLVKKYSEFLGGSITVYSKENEGSEMIVRLPALNNDILKSE